MPPATTFGQMWHRSGLADRHAAPPPKTGGCLAICRFCAGFAFQRKRSRSDHPETLGKSSNLSKKREAPEDARREEEVNAGS
jgi:hypothetical protein